MNWAVRISREGSVEIEDEGGTLVATIEQPVRAYGLGGEVTASSYTHVERASGGALVGHHAWNQGGVPVELEDVWSSTASGVSLRRRVTGGLSESETREGIQLSLAVSLAHDVTHRFFAPGVAYSPAQWSTNGTFSYSDGRLAYPVVAAHDGQRVVSLRRETTARVDEGPQRVAGQSRFLQRTDIGSVGFRAGGRVEALVAAWPYFEGDSSTMLDHSARPACALFPLSAALDETVEYRISSSEAHSYSEAVAQVFRDVVGHADPQPSDQPLGLAHSIDLRLDSAAKTFTSAASGFAAFVLNFDPELGYDSEAKAFGASFAEHAMGGSHDILEYGFTGRQLNLAYLLAQRHPKTWLDRGAKVVDSFVSRMATDSGWVYTLWDLKADMPLFACGDPRGTVMHYLGESQVAGTYSRMMAEAGHDLLLNIALHAACGRDVADWTAAAVALGDFFVRHQNADGSWYRAYAPDGAPIVDSEWFGYRSGSAKTATAAVVPYLLDLAELVEGDAGGYRQAAARAGAFVAETYVSKDEYRGGTLDNPNLVDKEAAFIAMRALLALHEKDIALAGGPYSWLHWASRAATVAVTWHSLWNVPPIGGTPLAVAGVRSTGWGGINSVWGVGVTDIYSLFFIVDLDRLGELVDEPMFQRVASLVAHSSLEILAVPENLQGFTDTGMQPEGISFCSQGVDDGLISKGDTWGGLGWPYTAGTYGLATYLSRRDESRAS